MIKIKFTHISLCLLIYVPLTNTAFCSVVARDLLINWGSFETPASIIAFNSFYNGSDYDYNAEGRWTQPINGNSREGFCLPSENNTLGCGWGRVTMKWVNPERNIICKLVPGGIGGSKCQYIALKDLTTWGGIYAYSRVIIRSDADNTGTNINSGDKLVFKIDSIKMADYEDLNTTYSLIISQNGNEKEFILSPSITPFSAQMEVAVEPNVNIVYVYIRVSVDGGTGTKMPGIYIDGAHLYAIKSGNTSYHSVEVPVLRNRSIKTISYLWEPDFENDYSTASSFDYVVFTGHSISKYARILKELNPNIGIYAYFASNIIRNDAGPKDAWNTTSLGYLYVSKKHPEWLYTNGISNTSYLTVPGFPSNYFSRHSDAEYQQSWSQYVLSKMSDTIFDGVLIDETSQYPRIPSGNALPIIQPEIKLQEIQQFLHASVPKIKAANYDVACNATDNPLTLGETGRVMLYPLFVPDSKYPTAEGFSANSQENTPRIRLREWAFLKPRTDNQPKNNYDKKYWLQCLNDMDEIKLWNTSAPLESLAEDKKTMLWMYALGSNSPGDQADDQDGWLHFSLCSYLLGQNDWTAFGCGLTTTTTCPTHVNIDYSITSKLGIPDGQHFANQGDAYCRWRRYKATSSDGMGGVVVVNGNDSVSRKYTLNFDAEDESGKYYAPGTKITLKPHTGRIFIQRQLLDVTLSVPTENVSPDQIIDITVAYANNSKSAVKDVIVRAQVPDQLEYLTGSAEKSGGHYYADSKSVVWMINSVIGGGKGTRTFKAKVK